MKALEEASLTWKDVDALYDCGEASGVLPAVTLAEYLNLNPRVVDTTMVGGSSYEYFAGHAKRDIAGGNAHVALMCYGSTAFSDAWALGTEGLTTGGPAGPNGNMDDHWGSTLVAGYAMVAARHMYEYGTTAAQLAEISVATRTHGMRNPDAAKGLADLGVKDVRHITVEDVVNSRIIADPIKLLECCLISDGGGAVVVASPDVARDVPKKPVWILGSGEGLGYPQNGGDITTTAAAQSGPAAFAGAGIRPDEIDIAMVYDSFTITVMSVLEDLGFCAKGEGGSFVEGGRLRFDTPDKPALNTDGGGLSSNHPGMRGIFLLIEAVRQLRGESTSQVKDARLAVAHGNGGLLSGRHAGGTVILGKD